MIEKHLDTDVMIEIQRFSSFEERRRMGDRFADAINRYLDDQGVSTLDDCLGDLRTEDLSTLNEQGYVKLENTLDVDRVGTLLDYFSNKPCFNAHVVARSDQVGRTLDSGASDHPFGSFLPEDVIAAPYLLELANSPSMLSLAAGYLGCTPSLYSMNAWWSFPGHPPELSMTQGFHRDEDDYKNCVLFLYLTDVDKGTGAHEYIRHTHRPELVKEILEGTTFPLINLGTDTEPNLVKVEFDALFTGTGYNGDAVYRKIFADQIDLIEGRPGDAFVSDPAGLHRARAPEVAARLIVWIRYGYYGNKSYQADNLRPFAHDWNSGRIPDTPRHRFINRLLLESGLETRR